MRALSTALFLVLLGMPAVAAAQRSPAATGDVQTITLTKSEDIADAAAVRAALRKLAEAAAPCNATARDANSCACSLKVELKRLRLAYDTAVARHADWRAENAVVSYVDPATRNSVAIALPVVKRQLVSCAQQSRLSLKRLGVLVCDPQSDNHQIAAPRSLLDGALPSTAFVAR